MVARFNLILEKKKQGVPPGSSNYVNTRKLASVIQQKIVNSELADSSMRYASQRPFTSSHNGNPRMPSVTALGAQVFCSGCGLYRRRTHAARFFQREYAHLSFQAQQRASHPTLANVDEHEHKSRAAHFQGEEAVATLRSYIRDREYQDPVTSEMMSLTTLRTVQDFWNWHEVFPKTCCVCARVLARAWARTPDEACSGRNSDRFVHTYALTRLSAQARAAP